MPRVQMYTTRWCGYCERAKALLRRKGVEFEEISLDDDPTFRQKLYDLTGGRTVPQIVLDGTPIGGGSGGWGLRPGGRGHPSRPAPPDPRGGDGCPFPRRRGPR